MKGLVKGVPKHFQSNFVGSITNFAIDTGVKGRVIPFVFSPESLTDTVQASFTQQAIPGSSGPQITYSSTGARTVSFSLNLPLDYLPPNSLFEDFEDYLNAFRALVYPRYSAAGGKVESPHCKLVMSNIDIDGVCQNCSIEYKTDRYANDGSMSASVSLSFLEVLDNVKDVDAKWIANSKVKVLGQTTMTTQSSAYDSFIENSTSNIVRDDICTITMLGPTDTTFQSSNPSLGDAQREGRWIDPGCKYTRKDKYNIKKLFGYLRNVDNITVSDISVDSSNMWHAVFNGTRVNLQTVAPNGMGFDGDILTYVEIYVPYYDGNKYEVDSAKWRYIRIKVVK